MVRAIVYDGEDDCLMGIEEVVDGLLLRREDVVDEWMRKDDGEVGGAII